MPASVPRHAIAAALLAATSTTGCLAGPGTALGGGPIGRTPNLRETALLPEPDSTRGTGFVLRSNRRDLTDRVRLDLNAAGRAYERLMGVRPEESDVRLVADERAVRVTILVGRRPGTPLTIDLRRDERGRPQDAEDVRVADAVVMAAAREWLTNLSRELAGETATEGESAWMRRERVPSWLRLGMLQAVAGPRWHEYWLAQLGRRRDSLPSVESLMSPGACDAACLAPFLGPPAAGAASDEGAEAAPPPLATRGARGGGRLPALEGRALMVASTFSLVQFMARREGPAWLRTLLTDALTTGDVRGALGAARSFTADPADIDRQWRVWLAPYAVEER